MSRKTDTTEIIADSGSTTVTVYSATYDHSSIPPAESSTVVETTTCFVNPIRSRSEMLMRDSRGQMVVATHRIYFPFASSVAVSHRLEESGDSDYYEVLAVDAYEDHKRLWTRKTTGRET